MEADLPLSFRASATLFYNAFFNLSDGFGTTISVYGSERADHIERPARVSCGVRP